VILESTIVTTLRDADRAATLALNDFDSAFTDAVMPLLSNRLFMAAVYLVLLGYLLYRVGWKKTLAVLIVGVIALGVADQVANLVKNSVERLRPCWDEYMVSNGLEVLEKKGGKFGFYSAHAATAAGVMTVIILLLREWDKSSRHSALIAFGIVWVLLVSISRVYVGKHFVGDIIVGIVVGTVISLAIVTLSRWVIRRYFTKFVN